MGAPSAGHIHRHTRVRKGLSIVIGFSATLASSWHRVCLRFRASGHFCCTLPIWWAHRCFFVEILRLCRRGRQVAYVSLFLCSCAPPGESNRPCKLTHELSAAMGAPSSLETDQA